MGVNKEQTYKNNKNENNRNDENENNKNKDNENENNKNKDNEDENNENENEINVKMVVNNKCVTDQTLYSIFHTLIAFVAVYLSFRCNNNKFNSASFIFALLCPYIYIIYVLATQGTCSK